MLTGRRYLMSGTRASTEGGVTVGALRQALASLDWHGGLTRRQIQRRCRLMPEGVYLRLPASKRYYSADDVLHDVRIASSRAEGDFLGAAPDLPEAEARDEGGPPAWGPSPLFTPGGVVDSTSAEDREPGPLEE
jgi:hypothetical protein